jgi:hypothetical protein
MRVRLDELEDLAPDVRMARALERIADVLEAIATATAADDQAPACEHPLSRVTAVGAMGSARFECSDCRADVTELQLRRLQARDRDDG